MERNRKENYSSTDISISHQRKGASTPEDEGDAIQGKIGKVNKKKAGCPKKKRKKSYAAMNEDSINGKISILGRKR